MTNNLVNKNSLIDSFYKIFCTCTRKSPDEKIPDNDYFKRRILGFKAELEFEKLIDSEFQGYQFLEGGQFAGEPIDKGEISSGFFIYTTFDYLSPNEYIDIYKKISVWSNVRKLFYIRIIREGWDQEDMQVKKDEETKEFSMTNILTPKFEFYSFDRENFTFNQDKSITFSKIIEAFNDPKTTPSTSPLRSREKFDYLQDYDLEVLMKIYATRYFMDYKKREKAHLNFLDLDGFLVNKENNKDIKLVEIKEKEPVKRKTKNGPILKEQDWTYGWDIRRLLWYVYLENQLDIPIVYAVRQIDNRFSRDFVQWDVILMSDFLKSVGWSSEVGGGGGSGTLQAPYLHFQRLSEVI